MALTYVGGTTSSAVGSTGTNLTVSLTSLSGGSASAPAEGDIVIVSYATGSDADRDLYPVTSGYTRHCDLYSGDSYDTNLWVATKIMGSTPDTSVVLPPSGNAYDAMTVSVQVWRASSGNAISIYDIQTATGINGGRPNPPAITPTRLTSIVISAGAYALNSTTALTSSDLSNFVSVGGSDTNCSTLGMGSFAWTSGTFTPAQFGGGSTSTSASWCGFSLVIAEVYVNRSSVFNGCVAYYQFEGNSNDDSNAENNGTDTDITYSDIGGLQGKYASFNGTSSKISCGDVCKINSEMSFSVWFKTNTLSGIPVIISKGGEFLIRQDGSQLTFRLWNGSSWEPYISCGYVETNKWYHLVCTHSISGGSATRKTYLNGVLISQDSLSGTFTPSTDSFDIGMWANGSYFSGIIDEVIVWNRVITIDEVRLLYILPKSLHNGLISYWKLDGNSYDYVGKNDGVDTDVSYSSGKINNGASFNGTSSLVKIKDHDNLKTKIEKSFSFWLKTDSYVGNDVVMIKNGEYLMRLDGSGGKFNFRVNIDPNGWEWGGNCISLLSLNTWYHIVCIFTKSGDVFTRKLYVNGNLVSTVSATITGGSINTTTNELYFAYNNGYGASLNGKLDEIAIWNRALTGEEIQQLFYAGNGNQYPLQTNMADMM